LLSACYSRVCSHMTDSPPGRRGQPVWSRLAWCSLCSLCVLESFRFDRYGQLFLTGMSLADCPPWGRDRPHDTSCSRIVRGPVADRPLYEVRFWRCCCIFQTVRSRVANRPTPASRTVRLCFRRVTKSFASLVSLSLWDCLGFVPRVGRSIVTTRP
jgi:hypothetical protein